MPDFETLAEAEHEEVKKAAKAATRAAISVQNFLLFSRFLNFSIFDKGFKAKADNKILSRLCGTLNLRATRENNYDFGRFHK